MSEWWVAAGYLYFAVISVVLTVIDVRSHRLPNVIVLPSYLVTAAILTMACLTGQPWQSLLRAGIAAVSLFAFYLLFRLIDRGWIGGGDVKLAGLLGAYLGWISGNAVILGVAAAFLCGGLWAAFLLLRRRANRHTRVAFGPWMILGAWIGILLG